jgi:hypothetical protein
LIMGDTPMTAKMQTAPLIQPGTRPDRTALNVLFRSGLPPTAPLLGPYAGSLVLLDIAPGISQLLSALLRVWLPWKGKIFDARSQSGDNIFTRDSRVLLSVFFPFYRDVIDGGTETYRAFKFRTYTAPGQMDPDRTVFKIDYNSPDNPRLTVRRVMDEIVELRPGVYLGKANLQWWWGSWQTVAYFMLEKK